MYTPKQTSEMLSIPASTLRRYAKQFSEHLSESANKSRGRRYTEQDIAILARAREMLSQGNSPQKTNELLSVISDEPPEPESTLALIPSISEALTEALDTARALRADVDAINERQDSTEAQLADAMARLEAIEHEQALPWYRKVFRLSD